MIAGALRMRAVCCRADWSAILCRPSEHHGARRRARSAARRDHAPDGVRRALIGTRSTHGLRYVYHHVSTSNV